SGGTINASSWDGGHGIGNGNSNRTSGTAINLDWTKDTFDSTEITADGYMGTVTFIKPYIRKADKVLAKKSNMDDVTIIPGFAVDGIMAEGRKYEDDGFTEESTSISVPVNRGLTVKMDLDVLNSGEEELEYTFTDMTARFTSALPKDTLMTLTVISGTDESPVYKHYYAVLGKSQSRVQLTAFADMERRGERFTPSDSDRQYLFSIDFPEGTDVSVYTNVGMEFAVTYEYEAENEETGETETLEDEIVISGDKSFTLLPLGELSVSGGTVSITRQPSGSKLLNDQDVYLTAEFTQADAPDLQNTQPSLTYSGSGSDTVIDGTWISGDIAAFEVGKYLTAGSSLLTPVTASFELPQLITKSNNQQIRWKLVTETGTEGATGADGNWNFMNNTVSSSVTSTYIHTPDPAPSLAAGSGSSQVHILKAEDMDAAGETVTFTVAANRAYIVRLERQTALHTFSAVSGTTSEEQDASVTQVSVNIPKVKGTYRAAFSMDGFGQTGGDNFNDNVYETFIVE
ncbi:MAG: hypothetical protein IJJ29_01100, partial [Solobacterium sp.]|nr:hypothetical protein [Solobacterium sp.]